METDSAWNLRLAREIRANREVITDILRNAGIAPGDAYDFLAEAIESVLGAKWSSSKEPITLLLQTLEAAVKTKLRSGSSSFPKSSPGGRMSEGRRRKKRQRGAE